MSEKEEKKVDVTEELIHENLDNGSVLQKYTMASQVANEAMAVLLKELAVGKKAVDLCELGDKTIAEKLKACFKKNKKLDKGLAFPTCINVNEIVCHYSPLPEDTLVLHEGDSVRIDLGVHIDGYIAVLGHTVVLTKDVIDGKKGDALACAQTCMDVASKLLFDGQNNNKITEAFTKIGNAFNVSLCEGVLSQQLKRYVIDGSKVIILKPSTEHTVSDYTIEDYEVYQIDICVSTGSGKLRETQPKTTIYKRNPDSNINLKLKSSHAALKEIRDKFNTLPFTIRHLDPKVGRLGLSELQKHSIIEGYPVLCESKGEFVAHLKSTFLIMKNGTTKSTGFNLQPFKSDKSFDATEILKQSEETKTKRKEEKSKAKKKDEDKMDISK